MANRKYTYNPHNPLYKYYEKMQKENKGKGMNNWLVLSEMIKMPMQTVISVARMDKDATMRMSLGTYIKLRDTIGVDMLSFKKDKE